jgi:hypothetical protein
VIFPNEAIMYKRNAILQPLGLAMVLAVGFGVLFAFIAIWILTTYQRITETPRDKLQILLDGTPIIVQNHDGIDVYHGLDGKIITLPKYDVFSHSGGLAGPSVLETLEIPLIGSERVRAFPDDQVSPATYWYFIHDGNIDGKGYFVGYDSKSKHRVGYIGRSGFSEDMPVIDEWFPMDARKMKCGIYPNTYSYGYLREPGGDPHSELDIPWSTVVMISGDQLLQIDLKNRSISALLKSPDMYSIGRVDVHNSIPDSTLSDDSRHHYLVLRTLNKVIFFDAAGKQVRTFEIPEDLRKRYFTLYDLGDDKALISYSKGYPFPENREELSWIDTSGKILRHEEATLSGIASLKNELWYITFVLPELIALLFFILAIPFSADLSVTYASALGHVLLDFMPALIVVCILSAILALFCYRRQRCIALPWTKCWVGFVFLFGLPGFLGYMFHRRWPPMENCPACGKEVAHDRERCSACGSAFPRPEPKGIEVFA